MQTARWTTGFVALVSMLSRPLHSDPERAKLNDRPRYGIESTLTNDDFAGMGETDLEAFFEIGRRSKGADPAVALADFEAAFPRPYHAFEKFLDRAFANGIRPPVGRNPGQLLRERTRA